jgi:hypothetical protein
MFDRNAHLLDSANTLLSWRRFTHRQRAVDLRLCAKPVLEFVTRRDPTCLGAQVRRSRNHLVASISFDIARGLAGGDSDRSSTADKRVRRCRRCPDVWTSR